MSMSTHVYGFRPPDERWQKMRDLWYACVALGIDPPAEVENFFDGVAPDPHGVSVHLSHPVATEWSGEMQQGIEVHLDKLPEGLTVIRFVNHY